MTKIIFKKYLDVKKKLGSSSGYAGKLYKTYLNTQDKSQFSPNIYSLNAYDYSVSKITLFGSIVLSFISFLVFGFNCALCIPCFECIFSKVENCCCIQMIITVSIIVLLIALLLNLLSESVREILMKRIKEMNGFRGNKNRIVQPKNNSNEIFWLDYIKTNFGGIR